MRVIKIGAVVRLDFVWLVTVLVVSPSWTVAAPVVGRKAASKYFSAQTQTVDDNHKSGVDEPVAQRWLTLHLGSFISSQSYSWGAARGENEGRANYGVTYLMDEWKGVDRSIRIEFLEYAIDEEKPRQLIFLPLLTFPMDRNHFPVYFGVGAGFGVFFHQLKGESELTFQYQLMTGFRFYHAAFNLGGFLELAMKNHLHLFSDGQLNGTALNGGLFFRF